MVNGFDDFLMVFAQIQLRGSTLACLDESAVDFALKKCPAAPLAWEQEEEEGLSKLVLDDPGRFPRLVAPVPGTSDVADYWLHPCGFAWLGLSLLKA